MNHHLQSGAMACTVETTSPPLVSILLVISFPLTALSVIIHTQNITWETPGLFVDVLLLICLQNKQRTAACSRIPLLYWARRFFLQSGSMCNVVFLSLISISIALFYKKTRLLLPLHTPGPILSFHFPRILANYCQDRWSATDGCIFVGLCQRRL